MQSNSAQESSASAYEGVLTEKINKLEDEIELLKFSITTCTSQIFVTTHEGVVLEMLKVKQLEQQRLLNFEAEKRELESLLMVRY